MVHLNAFTGKTTPACLMNPFALGAGGVTMGRHLTLTTLLMLLHLPLALCVKVELVLLSGVLCPQCLMLVVGSK